MIELAVVIIVKRKLELEKDQSNDRPEGLKLKKRSSIIGTISKVGPLEDMEQDMEKEMDGGIQVRPSEENRRVSGGNCLEFLEGTNVEFWRDLSTTDQIDMVSFAAFHFAYFVFNCGYWGHNKNECRQ